MIPVRQMLSLRNNTPAARSPLLSKKVIRVFGQHRLGILLVFILTSIGSAREPWTFIVTCDSRGYQDGIEKAILNELVAEILKNKVDFVLFPGDLVSGHTAAGPAEFQANLRAWVEIMKPVYDEHISVYVGRGNHEIADAWRYGASHIDPNDNFTTRWLEVFGSSFYPHQILPDKGPAGEKYMTYSVTHKNALVVMVDQYAGLEHRPVHKVNQRWLGAQLEANMKPHVFVAGHEPAFRAMHRDCLDNNPAERDAFWNSIRNAGGRTYFCGHDHFYDHARIDDGDGNPDNDIHQYIIGAAGAPPYSWAPPYLGNNSGYSVEQLYNAEGYGYMLVEIDGPMVTLTWMERNSRDLGVQGSYEPREVWSYTVTPELAVLAPNGGEKLVANQPYTLKWKTFGAEVENVTIDYSVDNGGSWQRLTRRPNTGRYEWAPVPMMESMQCLIRIADVRNDGLSDSSDGQFTIFECRKQLPGDLNGDCYVNLPDLAILAGGWLECGNPFEESCD